MFKQSYMNVEGNCLEMHSYMYILVCIKDPLMFKYNASLVFFGKFFGL